MQSIKGWIRAIFPRALAPKRIPTRDCRGHTLRLAGRPNGIYLAIDYIYRMVLIPQLRLGLLAAVSSLFLVKSGKIIHSELYITNSFWRTTNSTLMVYPSRIFPMIPVVPGFSRSAERIKAPRRSDNSPHQLTCRQPTHFLSAHGRH